MSLFKHLTNTDGWKNIITGLGMKRQDRTTNTSVAMAPKLLPVELTQLYYGEGLGHKIVTGLPGDMVRAGWEISGDKEGILYRAQKRLKVKKQLKEALSWARLYGGSIAVMDIPKTGTLDTPLNLDSLKGKAAPMRSLRVYPSARIEMLSTDFVEDTSSPWFEGVEKFRVRKLYGGGYFEVHRSRCLVFYGLPNPGVEDDGLTHEERFWGVSVLTPIVQGLSSLGAMLQGVGHMGQEFSVAKIKMSNLEQLVAENDYASIEKRAEVIALTKSLIHAVLLGEGEEFTRENVTFAGVPETIDRMMQWVAGMSGYPVTRLFGRSAAGMNATGDNDMKQYYENVKADQELILEPELTTLLQVINWGEGSPVDDKDLLVEFSPLQPLSEAEQATVRKTTMETDKGYKEMGIIGGAEIRNARFVGGWGSELSVEADSEPEELESDDMELLGKGAPLPPPRNAPPVTPTKAKPAQEPTKNQQSIAATTAAAQESVNPGKATEK